MPPPIAPARGGVVVPHAPNWHQRLGAWMIYTFIRLLSLTVRYRVNDGSGYFTTCKPGSTIYCIWHNRLALCVPIYRKFAGPLIQSKGIAALVSASRDGGFLTAILECFSVQPVRGSSSRRGPQALLELTTWAERGYDLAITPDGPRGPRYVVQPGIISMAQLTGLPILPFSYHLNWKIQLKSWDGFQIPLPFARCDLNAAPPVRIPRQARDEEREKIRQQLQETLKALSID